MPLQILTKMLIKEKSYRKRGCDNNQTRKMKNRVLLRYKCAHKSHVLFTTLIG